MSAEEFPWDQHRLLPEIEEWRERAARAGDVDTVERVDGWRDIAVHQAFTEHDFHALRLDAAERAVAYDRAAS